jgi:hypothetical protein
MTRASVRRKMASRVASSGLLLLALAIACSGKSEKNGSTAGPGDAGEGANAGAGASSGQAGVSGTSPGGSAGEAGADTSGSSGGGNTDTGGSAGDGGTATGGSAGVSDAGAGAGGEPTRPNLPQEPTPGNIRCGSQMCDAQSQLCCSGMAGSGVGGGGVGGSGMAGSGVAGLGTGGSSIGTGFESCSTAICPYRRECDEPADCVGTEVCCFHVVASPPSVLASSCEQPEQCAFDGYWLGCGSHEDCDAAGAPDCVAQNCKGETIQTCGPISRTACNF